MNITLQSAYIDYLKTQVEGAVHQEKLTTSNFICFTVPHETRRMIYKSYIFSGYEVVTENYYVWLGKKGGVYITRSHRFNRELVDLNFVLNMKRWVWKNHFGVDL